MGVGRGGEFNQCRSWAKILFLGGGVGGPTWPSEQNLGDMENF